MIRVLAIASMLLISQVVPTFAETIPLVCQNRSQEPPFSITIDPKNKTASYRQGSYPSPIGHAVITDAIFKIYLPMHGYAGIDHINIEIDRLTGVASWNSCFPSQCTGAIPVECHKGSPLF